MSSSVSIPDILASPVHRIRSLASGDNDRLPKRVWDEFSQIFKDKHALDQVPIADARTPLQGLQDGSLVGFPAMVQDTSIAPELYISEFPDGGPGGWGIVGGENDDDLDLSKLRECTVVWAVSIPGQSPWCFDGPAQSTAVVTPAHPSQPHKCPLTSPLSGAQIKIYDEGEARKLKVTDTVLFYGILHFEPLHSNHETQSHQVVPTIHVVFFDPLPVTLVPRAYTPLPGISEIRQAFINWLAEVALGGDTLAAEWIFLAGISRVRTRPTLLPLTLTISKFPQPKDASHNVPALHRALANVFPMVSTLPLSLTLLNQMHFVPRSVEEDLHSGFLQHPKGCILLFTESAIEEGRLTSDGLANIHAVEEIIKQQRLEYRFPYSTFQFDTDLDIIVLSQGKLSPFFKTHVNLPLNTTSPDCCYESAPASELPAEQLERFRDLVGGSLIGNITIEDDVASSITEEFVNMRSQSKVTQANGSHSEFTTDDLSQHLLVARLSALSFHRHTVTLDDWRHAKALFAGAHARSHA